MSWVYPDRAARTEEGVKSGLYSEEFVRSYMPSVLFFEVDVRDHIDEKPTIPQSVATAAGSCPFVVKMIQFPEEHEEYLERITNPDSLDIADAVEKDAGDEEKEGEDSIDDPWHHHHHRRSKKKCGTRLAVAVLIAGLVLLVQCILWYSWISMAQTSIDGVAK